MSEIDIKQLLLLVMKNAGEYAKLNSNMERVANVLEQVENNEIDLIGRNKGINTQLNDLMDLLKGWDVRMSQVIGSVFKEMREISSAISNISISEGGISKESIELIFTEQVEKRLMEEKDKSSRQKDKWIRILLVVAIALLIVILTMVGLDVAGVFDVARGLV